MLRLQGYFQAERFITDSPVRIPERKKTVVTVLDEDIVEVQPLEAHKKLWDDIITMIQNSDEVLEGEPEHLHFRKTDAL